MYNADQYSQFIYQSNFFIDWLPLLFLIFMLRTPRHFICFVVALNYLRLNERFDLPFSLPTIMIPLMVVCVFLHFNIVKNYVLKKEDKILTAFVILILLQTLAFHREDMKAVAMSVGFGLFYYYCLVIFLSNRQGAKLLTIYFFITCFIICMEPLFYHFSVPIESELWGRFHGSTLRIKAWGMWANANETAFLACLGIINLFFLILLMGSKFFVIANSLFFILLFFVTILLTGSRAGLASLLIFFSGMFLFAKSKKLKIVIIVLMLGGIFLAPEFFAQRSEKEMEGSSSERFDLRYRGRHLFQDNVLFGVGFNKAKENTGNGMALHSTFIQAFAETGFLGGSLLLWYLFLLGKRIYYGSKDDSKDKADRLFLAFVLGYFLCALFYFYFGNQLLTKMFFTVMAQIVISTNIFAHSHET